MGNVCARSRTYLSLHYIAYSERRYGETMEHVGGILDWCGCYHTSSMADLHVLGFNPKSILRLLQVDTSARRTCIRGILLHPL